MTRFLALVFVATMLAAADQPRLVIALKPDKNPEAMAAERGELSRLLGAAVGRPVEVIVPTSAAVISTGLTNGTIDAAHVASTDFAKEAIDPAKPAPAHIALAVQVKGKTSYSSVWLTLADKPYSGIAQLAGKPVAFASRTSTSGCIVPLYDLQQKDLIKAGGSPTDFFGVGNVFYGTGYVSAVERVLDGSAEAAAVSDYVFEGDKHLTPEQKARLKVLASQGPVPTHVLVIRSALPAKEGAALAKAITNLEAGLRDRVFGGALVEVDEQVHLAPIRAALAAVKAMKL
ncbi:MAG: phosphate/phosphite/phosphonate ABC transporter substrate-binding protein [Caulobacterales bacterium]|nr:phosphate/phosphite/phosphonate ABC transporter substrate-binding protein [Caulobacterales bacterium]